jgi:hypothetical protein
MFDGLSSSTQQTGQGIATPDAGASHPLAQVLWQSLVGGPAPPSCEDAGFSQRETGEVPFLRGYRFALSRSEGVRAAWLRG